jgi:hypothetical protein
MAALLDWKGSELRLGPFTVARVERTPEGWVAAGTKALGGLLRVSWQRRHDARQDIKTGVRAILKKQGVALGR